VFLIKSINKSQNKLALELNWVYTKICILFFVFVHFILFSYEVHLAVCGHIRVQNTSSPRWTCSHSPDRYIDLRTQLPGGVAALITWCCGMAGAGVRERYLCLPQALILARSPWFIRPRWLPGVCQTQNRQSQERNFAGKQLLVGCRHGLCGPGWLTNLFASIKRKSFVANKQYRERGGGRRRSHFLPLLLLNNAAAGNACFHDDSTAKWNKHSERVSLSNSRSSSSLPFSGGAALHRVRRVFVSLPEIQLALNLIQSDSPLLHHLPFFCIVCAKISLCSAQTPALYIAK